MKANNGFLISGFALALLGLSAAFFFAPTKDEAPTTQANETRVSASSGEQLFAPLSAAELEESAPVRLESGSDNPNWACVGFFADTLRATHIAWGVVTDVEYPSARVKITFQPQFYVKGTPLAESQVLLITDSNADLRPLIGTAMPIAFMEGERNGERVFGACHGVHSMTPSKFNPEASLEFYEEMVGIYSAHKAAVDAAIEENIQDSALLPAAFIADTKELLLKSLENSGTAVAHNAGRELERNAVFKNALTDADMVRIAEAVKVSKPGTFDRGYGIMLLAQHDQALLTNADVLSLCRSESAMVIIDHLGVMAAKHNNLGTLVPQLADIYLNAELEETPAMQRNAIELATAIGSKLSLPYFHQALGKMPDRPTQRSLLDGLGKMHDPYNLEPLMVYLNGGIPSQHFGNAAMVGTSEGVAIQRKQNDCLESQDLHKRTLLAIAKIDSEVSNNQIRKVYKLARDAWLKDFTYFLLPENRDWRHLVELLDEGDKSAISPSFGG